jgi:hypothetical protein
MEVRIYWIVKGTTIQDLAYASIMYQFSSLMINNM